MKYSSRNSLVLAIIIIFGMLVVGIWLFFQHRKISKIETDNVTMQSEINKLSTTMSDDSTKEKVESSLEELNYRVKSNNKVLMKSENSTITYNYLTKLAKKFTPSLAFNFEYVNEDDEKKAENIYKISGSASAWNLFNFIYNIEFQAPLYTIEDFAITEFKDRGVDSDKSNYVNYEFLIKGHFDETGISWDDISFKNIDKKPYIHNIFRTRIHAPRTIASEEKYPNIDNASLLSLTTDAALLQVANNVVELKENDKIAYGFLKKIDWQNQKLIFSINRIGIEEEKILTFNGIVEDNK